MNKLEEIPLSESRRQLAERLFNGVPRDGSSIGNKTLRESLKCTEDEYWNVRNELVDYGLLVKGKGKGGSVLLAFEADVTTPATTPAAGEKALYEPLRETLRSSFAKEKGYERVAVAVTADTGREGQWEHPDLVLGGFQVLPYVYGNKIDLCSFEVKRGQAVIRDVYQTVSHRRFVHFAYLLVCEPPENHNWDPISALAMETGVGLLVVPDAGNFDGWEVLVEPERNAPDSHRMNSFLAQRVTPDFRETWRHWLGESPNATSAYSDRVS